jgi:DNA repair exonuclease SbcCD ATPase subunit
MIIAGSGEQQRHEAEVSKYLAQIRSLQQQLSESRKNADKRVKGEDDKFVVPGMAEVADANEVADATDEPSRTGGDSDVAKVSDDLLEAIENGALKTMINRVQGEADELANESADNKARRLVNNLMGDLVSEKSRLNEMAKQLSLSIRQKEHRFQSREAGLREELKRKEEVIRLKDAAIVHHKEQLAQNASMLERLRGAKNSASEDQVLKQQLTVAQNTVNTMKDENKRLQRKLEELRAASAAVTSGGGKGRAQTPEEFNELKTKHDRAIKQVDEFKKVNAQLMQRLDASKKDKGTNVAVVEDLKKKLEAAVTLANNSKKDTERFVARADSLQKEEQRLRSELNKALEEVKKLKLEKAQAAIARPKSGTPAPGTPHGAAAAPASGTGTGSGTGSGTGGTPAAAA